MSFVAVLLLAGFTAHRYFYGYRRSGLPMYGAVTLGALLIMQAQVGVHFGMTHHGTFWLYHIQLLIGFSTMLWRLFIEYARGRSPVLAIEGSHCATPSSRSRQATARRSAASPRRSRRKTATRSATASAWPRCPC